MAASKKSKKGSRADKAHHEQMTVDDRRSNRRRDGYHVFTEQFLPYVLGAVGLFLLACFVLNVISGDAGPDEHLMGYVGYYICYFFLGLVGWTAYMIPLILIGLAVLWRKFCREHTLVLKITLSVLLMVMLSAFIHVFVCGGDSSMADEYSPLVLYETGAIFKSGGIIGGLLGFLLNIALRVPGTIVLAVVTLPLVVMGLVGVTPAYVFGKLRDAIVMLHEKSRKARADKAAAAKAEQRRAIREARDERDARAHGAQAGRSSAYASTADYNSPDGLYDDDELADDSYDPRAEAENRSIRLDPVTGEILDDERPIDGKRGKGRRASAPDLPDDAGATLPFYESQRRSGAEVRDIPFDDNTIPPQPTDRPAQAAKPDLPWESAVSADEGVGEYDDDTESMAIDLDEDYVPRTRVETVTEAEDAPTPVGETVTVRILRTEAGAVDERGLSEEELVLPSSRGGTDTDGKPSAGRDYLFPSSDMLALGPSQYEANEAEIAENTRTLREVLESFRIGVREISCSCGPTITRFEVKPDTGVRVRSIANLVDDIAMGLAKAGVRIEAPIPGKSAVGIEVPNAEPATVYLRNILETPEFRNHKSRIAACLGADVSGRPVILDINKMPHLLIAGATGTGKSVCINSLIMSILYKAKPDEVKLILIDPKKVEFAMYRDLPHLYAPVVSDPKKAAGALNSAVNEMERRFELIEEVGVRNLAGYNEVTAGDPERPPLPQMVIIIDELADLMMTAPAEVETAICRLAQKARAAGIHLVIGTQRPSVDVITGLIKANVPSRIAFTVKAAVDSRTILDTVGADKLIGRGDMLYAPIGCNKPIRVQGAFVSESEVERVVTYIKENNDGPVYNEDFTRSIDLEAAKCGAKRKGEQMAIDDFDGLGGGRRDNEDPKFWEALEVVVTKDKIGTSALQRALNLGYGRAAKIIDRMEALGFVGPDPGTKQGRKVIISRQELAEYKLNGLPGSGDADDGEDEEF